MKNNFKLMIIGIAIIAIIVPVVLLIFGQETTSDKPDVLLDAAPKNSYDEKIRTIKTENLVANEILSECGGDEHCAVESLWDLSDTGSEEAVLETLNNITSAYAEVGYYCHGPAHHLGMFVYGLTENLTKTLEIASKRDCGGALYHGGIENYFLSEMILNNANPEEIEFLNICQKLGGDAKQMKRIECAHGIGHGLAKVYEYDVFSSVQRCDEFSEPVEKRLCYEGVFMENVNANVKIGGGNFDKDDILYPCNEINSKYANACYYYHATYILKQTGTVYDSFAECNKISPETPLKACYMGIGRQLGGSLLNDIEQMKIVCQKGISEYQRFCYQGALIVLADQKGIEESFEGCKVFPDIFKMDCYILVGGWIRNETPSQEDRENICSLAENEKYFRVCVNARI